MGKRAAGSMEGTGNPLPPGRVARRTPRVVPPPRGRRSPAPKATVVAPKAKARPTQGATIGPLGPAPPTLVPPDHLLSAPSEDEGSPQQVAPSPEQVAPSPEQEAPTPEQEDGGTDSETEFVPTASPPRSGAALSPEALQREFIRLRTLVRSHGVQHARQRRQLTTYLESSVDRTLIQTDQVRTELQNLSTLVHANNRLVEEQSEQIARLSERIGVLEDHLG